MKTFYLVLITPFLFHYLLAQDNTTNEDLPKKPMYASNEYDTENWTSCREFLSNTTFNPKSIVDIDWKVFYFWNIIIEESFNIRFTIPSNTLIDRFSSELANEYPNINWTNAVLFMETSIDFSGIFIKTNSSGLFYFMPSAAIEHNIPSALMIFGLKLVEAGYLGIENCVVRLCYALAPVGKTPPEHALEVAALKMGFKGNVNRSHLLYTTSAPTFPPPEEQLDDADDDEEFQLKHDPDIIQFIF